MDRGAPAQGVQSWRIQRSQGDSAPDGDDGAASGGEIHGDDSRLLTEIARQTLNFTFNVALPKERWVDGLSDLDCGIVPRAEDRHPDRLGAKLAGFRVAPLAPSKAGVVVAGVAGITDCGVRRGAERRAERKTIDDEVWIGRRCDILLSGLRRNRNWSSENRLSGRWSSESRSSGRWSSENWRCGSRRSESAFGKHLASPRIFRSNSEVRQLVG